MSSSTSKLKITRIKNAQYKDGIKRTGDKKWMALQVWCSGMITDGCDQVSALYSLLHALKYREFSRLSVSLSVHNRSPSSFKHKWALLLRVAADFRRSKSLLPGVVYLYK